jgi:hypothetical protein
VPRAMLLFERQADASWLPTTVILATPTRLQGKCLAGDPNRDARLALLLRDARPPRLNEHTDERRTFLDWVDWALNALADGHTTWTAEVEPTATVEALYEREVAVWRPTGSTVERAGGTQTARPLRRSLSRFPRQVEIE